MSETVIDRAFAAMQAAPEDVSAHLAFYERVADTELYLLLENKAADDVIEPRVIEGGGENLSSPNFLCHYFSFSLLSFQVLAVAYSVHDVV